MTNKQNYKEISKTDFENLYNCNAKLISENKGLSKIVNYRLRNLE